VTRSIDGVTPDQEPILQVIGRLLIANAPAHWQRIDALAEILDDRAVFVLEYQPDDDGAAPEFFAARRPDDARALADCFLRLSQVVISSRGPLRKCHFHIRADGHIHADYEF
jgi:hypothetical protein